MKPSEGLKSKLYEICPEIERLGIHTVVLQKGNLF